jgi:hypothetical protein
MIHIESVSYVFSIPAFSCKTVESAETEILSFRFPTKQNGPEDILRPVVE